MNVFEWLICESCAFQICGQAQKFWYYGWKLSRMTICVYFKQTVLFLNVVENLHLRCFYWEFMNRNSTNSVKTLQQFWFPWSPNWKLRKVWFIYDVHQKMQSCHKRAIEFFLNNGLSQTSDLTPPKCWTSWMNDPLRLFWIWKINRWHLKSRIKWIMNQKLYQSWH
jgi:hypothetical protein